MSYVPSAIATARRRRRATTAVKQALRELRTELSQLNHRVGGRLGLKDVDLDCLDLIGQHGPIGPNALARLAGVHPATMTGVLDRLQRAGWIARERDPDAADRRAVTIHLLRDRTAEVFVLYRGMNRSMDQLCADYSEAELQVIEDFLRRTTAAGRAATAELAAPE